MKNAAVAEVVGTVEVVDVAAVRAKFANLRTALKAALAERDSVVDAALAALLCGEHVVLLGPPGTGKSALARALCQAISGANYFEWLMSRFTLPEEILGPLSLKALEQGKYERVTAGKLPQAEVAFVDEVFKSNSSILNNLLGILNERVFHDGVAPVRCPLLSCLAASNEMPEDATLNALWDRFLVRFEVSYVADRDTLKGMLSSADPEAPAGLLTIAEVLAARADVENVQVPDSALETLLDVKAALERAGIVASDRRWKRCLKFLRAVAWLQGDSTVTEDHVDALVDALWREPKERTTVAQVISSVANPLAAQALEILDAAKETYASAVKFTPDSKDVEGHSKLIATLSQANGVLGSAMKRLGALDVAGNKGRKVRDAAAEVAKMHQALGRRLAEVMGISLR